MKVHELARELSLTSKELIDRLEAMKVPVRNHMSPLGDDVVARVRRGAAAAADVLPPAGAAAPFSMTAADVPRGTAKSVDEEKIRQSAFLQQKYGSEIKAVRVIRAPRAEVAAPPPPAPAAAVHDPNESAAK